MIMRFLKRIPAGMMIVPMFLSSIVNTFFPEMLQIGSFTTAVFTSQGSAAILGVQLICMGAQLRIKELLQVVKRGGVLLLSKWLIGALIGIVIGKVFGMAGFLGLTTLAVVSAITNSNGSMYLALNVEYGDEVDQTAMSLLAINDGPFLTLLTLGASGLANVPIVSLIAVIVPILFGMLLGNLDEKLSEFLEPGVGLLLPFVGITLGAGINITNILAGGGPGILLGLMTVCISGPFVVLCDRLLNRRPGYAGWAVSSTAGNAIAVPAVIATVDPAWAQYVEAATTQVAASTVVTAILIPIITAWWAKKYGCPKFPLVGQDFSKAYWKK
ncbi:2-keto-3-deoxygluconate permease [Peptoniphilus equinus]|uniref:2-keto-3-deoxygluconate permease n=1 Tax=Peptoniphilus equinus TaxID=3016343 RepID=A0ABY7QTS6_9FIRM|nr:2-keto-3-deoxygluconate permease [Peptoniphilus equinus]WBW49856.1 2-keto-3-deoxygluconate permease [Peptoniphilus equinus]